MKIAVAQMRTTAGELERTTERMIEYAKRAASEKAELVVFPAAALMGIWPPDPPSRNGLLLDARSPGEDCRRGSMPLHRASCLRC